MKTSTKIIAVSSILFGFTAAWAAPVTLDYSQTGGATPYTVQKAAGGTAVCDALNDTDVVKIALSANVAAAFDCNGVNAGIATANAKGRGKSYRVHTAGGSAPIEAAAAARYANIAAAKTEAGTQATAALTAAGT